jgi:hypothetical protein
MLTLVPRINTKHHAAGNRKTAVVLLLAHAVALLEFVDPASIDSWGSFAIGRRGYHIIFSSLV